MKGGGIKQFCTMSFKQFGLDLAYPNLITVTS